MKPESKLKLFYFFGISFVFINLALIIMGHYWFVALPLAFALLMVLLFSADKLLLFIALITPLSFDLEVASLGFSVGTPNEPLLLAAMLMFFLRFGLKPDFDIRVLKHPITIIVVLHLIWMLVTSFTSEMPIVSFKYFASQLWFVVPMYFFGVYLFKDSRNIKLFFLLFSITLGLVVLRTFILHAGLGFARKEVADAVTPFFNDHTQYAATLALVAPVVLTLVMASSLKAKSQLLALVVPGFFFIGVLFSYSRAAWMSIIMGVLAYLVLAFRVKSKYLVVGMVLIGAVLVTNKDKLFEKLETHTQESSQDMFEHFISAANVSTDASNVERLNRWVSAFRMFRERPLMGWGPGTYQFVYSPFQLSKYANVVTTNFGDVGNAHSEYIGPLSESGLPAMVLMLLLVFLALRTGIRVYGKTSTREFKLIALGITFGLVTYFSHGVLNNFLNTDKVAVPFWAMMAILVTLDLKLKDQPN